MQQATVYLTGELDRSAQKREKLSRGRGELTDLQILSNAANSTSSDGSTVSRTSWVTESSCAACSTITEQEIFPISLMSRRQGA